MCGFNGGENKEYSRSCGKEFGVQTHTELQGITPQDSILNNSLTSG